jgi:uncharacterized protein
MKHLDLYDVLKKSAITIAIVGATDHPEKFGSIIYRNLKRKGYHVVPVNPSWTSVDGDPCFASVSDLPVKPDIINFVTQPDVTLRVLRDCLSNHFMTVWIQPGAANAEVLLFLKSHPFNWLANECIMVHAGKK